MKTLIIALCLVAFTLSVIAFTLSACQNELSSLPIDETPVSVEFQSDDNHSLKGKIASHPYHRLSPVVY